MLVLLLLLLLLFEIFVACIRCPSIINTTIAVTTVVVGTVALLLLCRSSSSILLVFFVHLCLPIAVALQYHPAILYVLCADDEAGDASFSSFYICPAAASTRVVLE